MPFGFSRSFTAHTTDACPSKEAVRSVGNFAWLTDDEETVRVVAEERVCLTASMTDTSRIFCKNAVSFVPETRRGIHTRRVSLLADPKDAP